MELLFSSYDLQTMLNNQPLAIKKDIEAFPEDYLLTVSEEDLVTALAEKAKWDAPTIGEPYIAGDSEIPIQRRDEFSGCTYSSSGTQITVRVTFCGESIFFKVLPASQRWNPPRATIHEGYLEVTYTGANLTADRVREDNQKLIADLKFHLDQITESAKAHNATIAEKIRPLVQARKKRILERRQMVASIGLPIARREHAPRTYAIPDVRRKPEVIMPVATETAFAPEPELAEQEYENILSIMRSMVHVMERTPQAFQHLKEEDLRWHFLFQLNGQYQGRATGETFNYKGKTDILIREQDRNVFIAECKFWNGKESLIKTIDQIVDRYLQWRDTKAAILLFNRNRDFANVLAQIVPAVESHPCFKRTIGQTSETEWKFIFRNCDDANRELYLTVLVFDVPR
jgi:hypothetical protein